MRIEAPLAAVALLTICRFAAPAQVDPTRELARDLAAPAKRDATVARVVELGRGQVPLLLSLAGNPPPDIDVIELDIGLSKAFGKLKVKEAIPFLIRNINIAQKYPSNVWTRAPESILARLPAVVALIQIGPEASKALMESPWGGLNSDDRLAAIFVVSRISGVPDARGFILSALGEANMQRVRSEEGLRYLDAHP
jgi:HEAT repeat protein